MKTKIDRSVRKAIELLEVRDRRILELERDLVHARTVNDALSKVLGHALNERQQYLEQLNEVQKRCTELTEENRRLKR